MRPSTVLAFDPGYERLGVALLRRGEKRDELLYSDCIRTSAKDTFPERLRVLGSAVEVLLHDLEPGAVALEKLYITKNQKTAMGVAEVRGVLLYLAGRAGIPVFEYTPLEVKVAVTGYGASKKQEVATMVERLVTLPSKKRLDDELDAIAVGITCLATTRSGIIR